MKLAKLLTEKTLVVDVGLGEDLQARQAAAVPLARAMAKEQVWTSKQAPPKI